MSFICSIILIILAMIPLISSSAFRTLEPVYIPTDEVQCGNHVIVNIGPPSSSGNAAATATYRTPFATSPFMANSIIRYEPSVPISTQLNFVAYKTAVTSPTTFFVSIQIPNPVYSFFIRYIAVNSTLACHINIYSNVILGTGTNPFSSKQTFTTTLNYSSQASASPFSSFVPKSGNDYSNMKILVFLTCFGLIATTETTTLYPPIYRIKAYPINNQMYHLDITVGVDGTLSRVHCTILIFDEDQIKSTRKYKANSATVDFSGNYGGFISIPQQFQNNILMGLTDFESTSSAHYATFDFIFGNSQNGEYGIKMNPQYPNGYPLNQPFSTYGLTLFYLSALECPGLCYYYDVQSELCTECHIVKQKCNGFYIEYQNSYTTKSLIQSNISIFNQNITVTSVQQKNQYLYVHIQYSRDIVDEEIVLQYASGDLLKFVYNPALPPLHYSQGECQIQNNVTVLLIVYAAFSYFILLISLFSAKIVGLELFGVLQIAYFSLSQHTYFNLYLAPLAKFKLFNGLNVNIVEQFISLLPNTYQAMQVHANFINNCNIMLLIFVIFVISFGLLCILFKLLLYFTVYQYLISILKQGIVTFVIFNCFNFSFASATHWKYAHMSDKYYAFGIFLSLFSLISIVFTIIYLQIGQKSQFGEFKNKFKTSCSTQLFIPLSLIFRTIIVLYFGMQNNYVYSTLISLFVSLVFLMYILINLPYSKYYHNYRTAIIHFTYCYIILMANYYRTMKINTPIDIKARISTPAVVQLVLIGVCILVSLIVTLVQIYKKIIMIIWKKKQKSVVAGNTKIKDYNVSTIMALNQTQIIENADTRVVGNQIKNISLAAKNYKQ